MQASRHSRPLPLTATASTMLETAKENEATMFQTVLTERMNLRAPIVAAPIGRGANPQFLGAVATAGALPFIALTHLPEDTILETLRDCANHAGGPGRFGINLALIKDQHCRLDRALEAGLRTVSLWRGDPTTYTRKAKRAGATIFWTIGSTSEARRAADLGVDFLVAQGREAGGHLVGSAPTMSLLPAASPTGRAWLPRWPSGCAACGWELDSSQVWSLLITPDTKNVSSRRWRAMLSRPRCSTSPEIRLNL